MLTTFANHLKNHILSSAKKIFHHPTFFPLFFISLLTAFIFHQAFAQSGIFPTHDGEFHIIRSLHFFSELKRGQLPVRIIPELAHGHSYPVFQFFYPLPYYVVAVFQLLGLSATDGWRMSLVLITFLSLAFFYKWLRTSLPKFPSLVGTAIFALAPYRMLTLFVTGQIGGYYSLLFAPMIALGLHCLLTNKEKEVLKKYKFQDQFLGGLLFSVGLAGLILSHLISVIIFFLPLAVYAGYLLFQNFSWIKLRSLILWSVIGLGLSAFYLLPFLVEKSGVKLGHSILINYQEHWPTLKQLMYSPWGYGYSDASINDGLSFQAGVALLISWFLSIILIIFQRIKDKQVTLFSITLGAVFILMLSFSQSVWQFLTPLQYLQYPWRLLAATSFLGAWLTGWVVSLFPGKKGVMLGLGLMILALINVRHYTQPWHLDWKTDQDFLAQYNYYGSTDISWELMPAEAKIKPGEFGKIEVVKGDVEISEIIQPDFGNTRLKFAAEAYQPSVIILPVWDYPAWEIKVNDELVKKQTADNSLLSMSLPPGVSVVELSLVKTRIQKLADVVSVISLLTLNLIGIIIWKKKL